MAIDHRQVREIMRKRLIAAVPNLPPSSRRAWENRKFTPPSPDSKLTWVREHYIIVNEHLPATNLIESNVIVQYDVVAATGRGTEACDDIGKEIREAFKPATSLTGKSDITIVIDRSEPSPPLSDEVWYFIPIKINIRIYVANTT